jgi:hypothetical protein
MSRVKHRPHKPPELPKDKPSLPVPPAKPGTTEKQPPAKKPNWGGQTPQKPGWKPVE